MEFKTTPKGTELPLLNLKGKPYLQVAHRLVWFREDHPLGRIQTTLMNVKDTEAVARAEIYILSQRPDGAPVELLVATAHKKETEQHFGDFIEKAETGAIGRALGMAGYGTQYEPTFDEGDRLADSPIPVATKGHLNGKTSSANPVVTNGARRVDTTTRSKAAQKDEGKAPVQTTVQASPRAKTNEKIELLSRIILQKEIATITDLRSLLEKKYSVTSKEELNDKDAEFLAAELNLMANGFTP